APIPAWLITQIEISFLFFAVACIYACLRGSGDLRTTAGVAVLTVPLLARGYSLAAASYESLAFGRLDARQLAEHLGEAAALIAGVAAPLLLPPRAQTRLLARRAPLLVALGVTMAVTVVAAIDLSLVQAAAGAMGFALPDEPAGRLVYMAALFG